MGKELKKLPVKKVSLDVEGMSCSHCENRIKKALGEMKGVFNVSVDLEGKKVTVAYESSITDIREITDAIVEQGYEVI